MDPDALWCNICPKQPRFSDVSHLLTHVSSKAHLSHYFKLQVRSHQEPQAGHLLEQYDRWYKVNNLAKLLSDRMASKEARKSKTQGRAVSQATILSRKATARKVSSGTMNALSPQGFLPDFLDPRLSQSYFDVNHAIQDHPFPNGYSISTAHPTSNSQVQPWPICATQSAPSPRRPDSRPWKAEQESDSEDGASSVLHATPRWSDQVDTAIGTLPRSFHRALSSDPFIDDDQSCDYLDDNGDEKEKVDEMTKLKGVLWPGMDIFDSATEQMRRKRNQKKDGSILKMMEKTSEGIEPTELVFSPTGILRKQRVISGNVEDSSPLKGETPIPKRRAVRPKRGPLSQSDPNAIFQRGQDRQRTKKRASHGQSRSLEELSRQALPLLESPEASRPFGYYGAYYSSLPDDDAELKLSLSGFDQKSRGGFTVFNDEWRQFKAGPKNQFREADVQSASSAPSLPLHHRHQSVALGSFQSAAPKGYTTTVPGMIRCYPTGKENIEPILTCQGRIDPHVAWRDSWAKHQYTDEGYPPQYLFGEGSSHVEFGLFGGSDFSGYSSNPLAASCSHFPIHDDQTFAVKTSPDHNTPKIKRAPSSDSTISDLEQDDVGRLYLDGSSD